MSDSATPKAVALQAPPSVGFPRQEYWRGLSFPSPGSSRPPSLGSPALQADSLPSEPPGKGHQLGTRVVCRAEECKLLRTAKTSLHLFVTIAVCKRTARELWALLHSCFLNLGEIQNLAIATLGNLKYLLMKMKKESEKVA